MEKDFDSWNNIKKSVHGEKERPFFGERDVWFCSTGLNVGSEQDGKGRHFLRPIIVIKKINNETFWGISTTSKRHRGLYYFQFMYKEGNFTTAILHQLKLIDSKRLNYKIGNIGKEDFIIIKKRLISMLEQDTFFF